MSELNGPIIDRLDEIAAGITELESRITGVEELLAHWLWTAPGSAAAAAVEAEQHRQPVRRET